MKYLSFIFLIVISFEVYAYHETTIEQVSRRVPPIIHNVSIPVEMNSGESYFIEWSIIGYEYNLKSNFALFVCGENSIQSCGADFSQNVFSTELEPYIDLTLADWKFEGVRANEYIFRQSVTIPQLSDGEKLVLRFYQINSEDEEKGKQSTSILFPGGLENVSYVGNSGRKIELIVSTPIFEDEQEVISGQSEIENSHQTENVSFLGGGGGGIIVGDVGEQVGVVDFGSYGDDSNILISDPDTIDVALEPVEGTGASGGTGNVGGDDVVGFDESDPQLATVIHHLDDEPTFLSGDNSEVIFIESEEVCVLPDDLILTIPPNDFELKVAETGWKLYYSETRETYVQEIDLKYKSIDMECYGDVFEERCRRVTIERFWKNIEENVLSVSNGQFFDGNLFSSLALATSNQNGAISYGYETEVSEDQRMIVFHEENAVIYRTYNRDIFDYSRNGAIVGFNPSTISKNGWAKMGRTFLGLKDPNGQCNPEISTCFMRLAYIINAVRATQDNVMKIANDFGISSSAIIMLDGSGSTQMISKHSSAMYGCEWGLFSCEPDFRYIPQFMVVRSK